MTANSILSKQDIKFEEIEEKRKEDTSRIINHYEGKVLRTLSDHIYTL